MLELPQTARPYTAISTAGYIGMACSGPPTAMSSNLSWARSRGSCIAVVSGCQTTPEERSLQWVPKKTLNLKNYS